MKLRFQKNMVQNTENEPYSISNEEFNGSSLDLKIKVAHAAKEQKQERMLPVLKIKNKSRDMKIENAYQVLSKNGSRSDISNL